MEQFAGILDRTIVNLKENGNCGVLGDGLLYLRLQKKLPDIMLTQYQFMKGEDDHMWKH